jgi:hypothetical protein
MIAIKRDGDESHALETEESIEPVELTEPIESVPSHETGNLVGEEKAPDQAKPPIPSFTPLKIAMDDRGRASIPDRLVDPQDIFSQPMVLPGIEGLPFRGANIPDLKETDPSKFRPQVGQQIFANVLDLSDKDDMKYYQQILQLVGNGYAQISVEERKYDDSIRSWRVFIRWILYYGYIVEGADSNG